MIAAGGPGTLPTLTRIRASVVVVDRRRQPTLLETLEAPGSGWRIVAQDDDGALFRPDAGRVFLPVARGTAALADPRRICPGLGCVEKSKPHDDARVAHPPVGGAGSRVVRPAIPARAEGRTAHRRPLRAGSLTPPVVAVGIVLFWSIVVGYYFGGHDALTYLAAGERLNAGHPLYALSAGDRPVPVDPPFFGPLLSPPLIAVVFRPIALFGLPAMWVWTILLGLAVAAVVWRIARTWPGALFVVILGLSLAMAAVHGNVSNLFIPAYVALWRWRDRPVVGALVGVMAVTKLLPIVFVGYLVGGRRFRALGWCIVGAALALVLTVAGAGLDNTLAYLAVARDAMPQPISVPYLFGSPWLSPLLLAAGTVAAMLLGERAAFRLCVLTIVIGAPVLGWRELAALVALLAPSAFGRPTAGGPAAPAIDRGGPPDGPPGTRARRADGNPGVGDRRGPRPTGGDGPDQSRDPVSGGALPPG